MTLLALAIALASQLGYPRAPPAILRAAAEAVAADPSPLEGSADLELAAMLVWGRAESALQVHPRPWLGANGLPVDPLARGWLQVHAASDDPGEQAREWLRELHDGARVCPDHPAAPLSGGCAQAWRLSDRRMAVARRVLGEVGGE